jgi:hypothetical protein
LNSSTLSSPFLFFYYRKASTFLHHFSSFTQTSKLFQTFFNAKTMASSSTQTKKLPLAGGWSETVLSKLPPNTIFEPVMNMEKRRIWENQVMFPYSLADKTHAFGGPLPDAKSKSSTIFDIFPVHKLAL